MTNLYEILGDEERRRLADMNTGHKNGCVKWTYFIPIMLALTAFILGGYGFTTAKAEATRLEMKADLEKVETRLIQEIRAIGYK